MGVKKRHMFNELQDPEIWSRFKQMCRIQLHYNMNKNHMDYQMMKRIVNDCQNSTDVWLCVSVYNETYFRELLQTFANRAVKQVAKHDCE